jgi:hypothetical protein
MALLIISIVGLFLLKYSAAFRKFAFFNESNAKEATHIFITGNDKQNYI